MRMHRNPSWFPLILIGLSIALLLAVVIFVAGEGEMQETVGAIHESPGEEVADAITGAEYETLVTGVLRAYQEDEDAARAYQGLIDISVPAGYKDVHLELVIAFGSIRTGDVEEGRSRLDILRNTYTWLP